MLLAESRLVRLLHFLGPRKYAKARENEGYASASNRPTLRPGRSIGLAVAGGHALRLRFEH